MAKTNNFIDLHGKQYNARTGAFMGSGKAVDGFASQPHRPKPHPLKRMAAVEHTPKPIAAHHPQHAKTLRRDVVHLPKIQMKPKLRVQSMAGLVRQKPGGLALAPKQFAAAVDQSRARRASAVPHSPYVGHFNNNAGTNSSPHIDHRALTAPVPVRHQHIPVTPAPKHATDAKERDIFEQAIAHARSHEETAPEATTRQKIKRVRKKHRRIIGAFATVALIAVLGAFIFYQNRAQMQLQLAAGKSGVAASIPAFKPKGFSVGKMTYSPGSVTIGFQNASGKNYSVVQKSSNWDSETLLQNFVATSGQPYNAYQAAGRTVYIYGNGNATWVNGGIWYQVKDNGNLNKDQVINLATSI